VKHLPKIVLNSLENTGFLYFLADLLIFCSAMPFFPNFDKLLVSYARQGRADFSPYTVDNSVDNWVFDN
jgi:hypothetical protein